MAISFPNKKVMFDIVSGRETEPSVTERDGWKVLRVTYAQMEDYHTCRKIMNILNDLLGSKASKEPAWNEQTKRINELMLSRSA